MSEKSASPENKREQTLAKRRRQILEAALACFIENGFHQTGVRDIAKRAGVSLGNVYNHFPGKHDVLVEVAALERSELEPYLAEIAETTPSAQGLDRFIEDYADYVSEPDTAILTLEIAAEALRKPDIAALFVENQRALVDSLANYLERGAQSGCFRTASTPQGDAQLLIEMIDSFGYRSLLGDQPPSTGLSQVKAFIRSALLI